MEQMHVRNRARVPAIQCGVGATGRRIDRHLAVLGAPALPAVDSADAAGLIRELTPRGVAAPASRGRGRVSLMAPLRRLRRTLFGGRNN